MRARRWVFGGLVLGTVGGFVTALVRSHAPADSRPPTEAYAGRRPATGQE